tara:strand:- start:23 stop:766 length:744 start_codon:yes stop_codon:yes gene_type:complete
MPLPTLSTPKYQLTIPSTKEKITYRPFLVKEEKILLQALESQNSNSMLLSMADVIKSCTDGKVDAEKYPLFDLEYMFLHLRMKSVGEVVDLQIPCQNTECGEMINTSIDLDKVKIVVPDDESRTIKIDEKLGLTLKYPTLKEAENYDPQNQDSETMLKIITDCIVSIYDEEEVYQAKDHTRDELEQFVESIPSSAFNDIVEFFETIPKLSHTLKVKCPKCKHMNEFILEGLEDFFRYASSTTLSIAR